MIIDAHQHFWDPARGDYDWMTPASPLHRIYGPDDLKPHLDRSGIEGVILVQAAPSAAETDYLLGIALATPWVRGVVGWIDLAAADASEQIIRRGRTRAFVGVRPMLQDLPERDWILRPELSPGLEVMAREEQVFDALIRADQLPVCALLADRHPQLSIVVDHAAKPAVGIRQSELEWRDDLARLADRGNVSCKLSGLCTERRPDSDPEGLERVIQTVLAVFGPDRVIWGSDWPVVELAERYQHWFDLARQYVPEPAHAAVFGATARRVYRLDRSSE